MLCNCTLNEAILLTFSTKNLHFKKEFKFLSNFYASCGSSKLNFQWFHEKSAFKKLTEIEAKNVNCAPNI